MHILRELTPEALTVIFTAVAAGILLLAFVFYARFRRVKDESYAWNEPVHCIWRCVDCGAEALIVAESFDEARTQAQYRHDQLLAEHTPLLLRAYTHHILVTQER